MGDRDRDRDGRTVGQKTAEKQRSKTWVAALGTLHQVARSVPVGNALCQSELTARPRTSPHVGTDHNIAPQPKGSRILRPVVWVLLTLPTLHLNC